MSLTDGQLRHIKTGEPFVFNAREDLHRWNQKRYEALGEVTHCFSTGLLKSGCSYNVACSTLVHMQRQF